ncbi:MAG: vitamin K epoxide reductase family protein [Anaerolineales bacterium]|nr:vitamin K epoxide reductase family protein [Anaerolineales bacterium]
MRRTFGILSFSMLLLATLIFLVRFTSPAMAATPVVHMVLFWSDGCPQCETILLNTLPELQEKHGEELNILLVELITLEDIDRFYQVGMALGLSKEQIMVPLAVIDYQALIGAEQIPAELPELIKNYLSGGGAEYPELPALASMLPRGIAFTAFDPHNLTSEASAEKPVSEGFTVAWIVMVGMLLALVVVGVVVTRAFLGKPMAPAPNWVNLSIPVLAIIGLGVALYLSYVEVTATPAVCGPIGDCNAVQTSPYAKLFGFLSVGLLGVFGYLLILAAWLWRRFRKDQLAAVAAPALFGMTLFATIFSVYLTYLELFRIRAVCLWCTSSAIISALLMLASLDQLMPWITADPEEDES